MRYRRFSKVYLEKLAGEVRARHGQFDGDSLRVEHLVAKLGFDLIPVSGLREEMGIEAYLPKRPNTIIVDQAAMDFGTPRYFFTLAEEIAHSLIHLNADGATPDTLHDWVMGMSQSDYEDLERDAKYLAGAMLMPREQFTKAFNEHCASQKKALGNHGDRHTIIRFAVRRLYMAYSVSFEAAAFRTLSLRLITPHDVTMLARYRPAAFSWLVRGRPTPSATAKPGAI